MNPIIQSIIVSVSAALIVIFLKFCFKWFKRGPQPKIELKLSKATHSCRSPINEISECIFKARIELFNNSGVTAHNISIIDYSTSNPFKNSNINQTYLESLNKQYIETEVIKYLNNEERQDFIKRSDEYLPEEFDYLSLILKYSNSNDKYFYTKYIKINKSQKSIFHFFKPRIRKSI